MPLPAPADTPIHVPVRRCISHCYSVQVIRTIISKTAGFSSADVFAGLQKLSQLRGKVRRDAARCREAAGLRWPARGLLPA